VSEALVQKVTELLVRVLQAKGVEKAVVNPGEFLYEGGLGLDSLDAATLAAMLENEFKSDPYSSVSQQFKNHCGFTSKDWNKSSRSSGNWRSEQTVAEAEKKHESEGIMIFPC
jgi:acyl carrier protein